MEKIDAVNLILSDAHGIYIPRYFVTGDYNEVDVDHCNAWHIDPEDAEILKDPENNWYWETWDDVLGYAYYMNGENKFTLWQDGDLWAICYDAMTNEEKQNFGFED